MVVADLVCLGEGDDFAKGAYSVFGGPGGDEIWRAGVVAAGAGDDWDSFETCWRNAVTLCRQAGDEAVPVRDRLPPDVGPPQP